MLRLYRITSYNVCYTKLLRALSILDISDRKHAEELINQKNEILNNAVAEKDKFFSIIAHDLKSPFNSILGFSELLSEVIEEKNYEQVKAYSDIINKSSKRAMELLQNLMRNNFV